LNKEGSGIDRQHEKINKRLTNVSPEDSMKELWHTCLAFKHRRFTWKRVIGTRKQPRRETIAVIRAFV